MEPGSVVVGLRGEYRIEARHGAGGFGVAYRATDLQGASVIVKELHIERASEWKAIELFEREARVLSGLAHPNIPAFRDFFVHGGPLPLPVSRATFDGSEEARCLVLVQELVSGLTLEQRVEAKAPLSTEEAEAVLRDLLGALAYLHERTPPVIHRDLKPANVVLSPEGNAYLVDFGATQTHLLALAGEERVGSSGSTIVGTPEYMPPEQIRGDTRPASDLYALGLTIAVAMAGRPPSELRFNDRTGKLALDRALPSDTPPRLESALAAMVAPLLGQRARSAREVLAILDNPRSERPVWAMVAVALLGASLVGVYMGRASTRPMAPVVAEEAVDDVPDPPIPMASPGQQANPRYHPVEPAAPGSIEAAIRANQEHWVAAGGDIGVGDYVADMLNGRLDQPQGRGMIGRVLSMVPQAPGRAPVATVDFGQGHQPVIFLSELARVHVVPDASPVAGQSGEPFDRGAAAGVLRQVDVSSCKKSDGPTGSGHISIMFAPSGTVQTAVVDQPPFAGTPVGSCVAERFRKARVPAFAGEPTRVGKSFAIH
jgi:serine/threonine protein kinase